MTRQGRRVALVSGGNRGIGLAICRGLAERGLDVALGTRELAAGQAAAGTLERSPLGGRVLPVTLEVGSDASVAEAVALVERELGPLDVLVNNAAVYLDEGVPGLEVPIAVVRETLEVNVVGALRLAQAVAPGMRARRYGRIVNLSSGYGAQRAMRAGVLAYKLSKLALNGMTQVLADELRGSGVLVNALDPGWVHTRMGGRSAPRTPEQGADTALWLATLPDDGPTGGFFHDRRPIPW